MDQWIFSGSRLFSSRPNGTDARSFILSGQGRSSGLLGNLVRSVPGGDPHFVELQNKYGGQGLQIIGVSMDDGPVRDFYQRFKMNYPVVMGNAKTGALYGGILGLPIAFLIGRDGQITAKHIGATDISVFEEEIANLLRSSAGST